MRRSRVGRLLAAVKQNKDGMMAYTEQELLVVCPKCKAAKGGKCLDKVLDRSHWVDKPHEERVELAKG